MGGLTTARQPWRDALLTLVTQGSLQAAVFRSDDLDTTFDCAFRVPSGHLVRIPHA
jgi:hypothetical protein